MFLFIGEGFKEDFNDVFGFLSSAGKLPKSGELLGTSVTVEEWSTRVLDFQSMSGLVCFKNGIPRMTDSVPIGAIRNISWCFTLTILNFSTTWQEKYIAELLSVRTTFVIW